MVFEHGSHIDPRGSVTWSHRYIYFTDNVRGVQGKIHVDFYFPFSFFVRSMKNSAGGGTRVHPGADN